MRELKNIWTFVKGFILLNIAWYVFAILLNSKIVPMPHEVYIELPTLMKQGFYSHINASLYRVSMGLIISFLIGISIGMLLGYSKKANQLLNPLLYFTYPAPKMALLPVAMTIFGLGDGSKIMMIVLITVFTVIVSVRDAVANVLKESYNPLISLGASKLQLFYNVTLPAIVPEILTNIRLCLGTALSILFFSEAYGTNLGVGYFIQDAWTRIDYIDMYAGIVVLSVIGMTLFIVLDIIESIVCRWKKYS